MRVGRVFLLVWGKASVSSMLLEQADLAACVRTSRTNTHRRASGRWHVSYNELVQGSCVLRF